MTVHGSAHSINGRLSSFSICVSPRIVSLCFNSIFTKWPTQLSVQWPHFHFAILYEGVLRTIASQRGACHDENIEFRVCELELTSG
jgi:hypothetical protein